MARPDVRILSVILAGSVILSCGGVEKSPTEPPAPTERPPSKTENAEPSNATPSSPSVDAESQAPQEPSGADKTEKEEAFKPERPPQEFLTDRKLSFETNFAASEIGIKTDERCREEHAGDMEAVATCKKKVSARIGLRVLRFHEKAGAWWFLVYSKKDLGKSSQLAMLHKVMCKFGKQTDNTITVELIGKDEMKTAEKLPREFVVTIPNNYSIDLEDPVNGRMNYTAKYENLPGQDE